MQETVYRIPASLSVRGLLVQWQFQEIATAYKHIKVMII